MEGNNKAMREALYDALVLLEERQKLALFRNGFVQIKTKYCDLKDVIEKCRSALAAPPHEAKWTANCGYEFACCSKCGHMQYAGWDSRAEQAEKIGDFHELYKFCPNCGSQMKGATYGSK